MGGGSRCKGPEVGMFEKQRGAQGGCSKASIWESRDEFGEVGRDWAV